MSESILSRIKQIADNEDISITQIEKVIGASKGVLSRALSQGTDINSKWVEKVVENYPLYNPAWLLSGKGEMKVIETYVQKRQQLKNTDNAGHFPVYSGTTRLREDVNIAVYEDDPTMQIPIGHLPKSAFPGCDHGERAFGNSMYPRLVNQGYAIGKTIDKASIVYNEIYGIHIKGGGPPVIKYVHPGDKEGCIKLVSENAKLAQQEIHLDTITFIFRVLYVINPA